MLMKFASTVSLCLQPSADDSGMTCFPLSMLSFLLSVQQLRRLRESGHPFAHVLPTSEGVSRPPELLRRCCEKANCSEPQSSVITKFRIRHLRDERVAGRSHRERLQCGWSWITPQELRKMNDPRHESFAALPETYTRRPRHRYRAARDPHRPSRLPPKHQKLRNECKTLQVEQSIITRKRRRIGLCNNLVSLNNPQYRLSIPTPSIVRFGRLNFINSASCV